MAARVGEQGHLCALPASSLSEAALNETWRMRAIPGEDPSEVAENVNPHLISIGPTGLPFWDVRPISVVSYAEVNPVVVTRGRTATPKNPNTTGVYGPVLLRQDESEYLT